MGKTRKYQSLLIMFFILVGIFLNGCSLVRNDETQTEDNRIKIVATTTMLTDLVESLGASRLKWKV